MGLKGLCPLLRKLGERQAACFATVAVGESKPCL